MLKITARTGQRRSPGDGRPFPSWLLGVPAGVPHDGAGRTAMIINGGADPRRHADPPGATCDRVRSIYRWGRDQPAVNRIRHR
jgi:hypothetical protein